MEFNEFKTKWETDILPNKPNCLRKGQALMNFLYEIWFEEYERISSVHYYERSDIDCYYNDSLIENTFEHLENKWKTK
jgi:hypothetical protein